MLIVTPQEINLISRVPGFNPPDDLIPYKGELNLPLLRACQETLARWAGIDIDIEIYSKPGVSGGYSLWYLDPPAIVMAPDVPYWIWFHEMGHIFTLQHLGKVITGPYNSIYSECLARILQYTVSPFVGRMVPHMSDALYTDQQRGWKNVEEHREKYDKFVTFNDPTTPGDDTFNSFCLLAYEFVNQLTNYDREVPRLLSWFRNQDVIKFKKKWNGTDADRAEIMVNSFSYALERNMDNHFEELGLPI
ncbi:MAG: hypothetical protein DSY80_00080 [Desulfocapsa sp.]|nr:MAG: hypothetical protein DSY80_00080 [Desulfocapsa sp.]